MDRGISTTDGFCLGLLSEQNFGHASGWDGTGGGDVTVPPAPTPDATTYGSLTLQNAVVYQGPNGSGGYDAMGHVVSYQYRDASGRVDQYAVTYLRKDDYLESTTSGQNISNTPNVRPATDESYYDSRGNRVAIAQHTQFYAGTVADTVCACRLVVIICESPSLNARNRNLSMLERNF